MRQNENNTRNTNDLNRNDDLDKNGGSNRNDDLDKNGGANRSGAAAGTDRGAAPADSSAPVPSPGARPAAGGTDEILPSKAAEDDARSWGDREDDHDTWLKEQKPPHWG